MEIVLVVVSVLVALGIGGVAGYFGRTARLAKKEQASQEHANKIVEESEEASKQVLYDAREEALKVRSAAEEEAKQYRQELLRMERRLHNREENLEKRGANLDRRERGLQAQEQELQEREQEIEELKERQQRELESIAGLTNAQAREMVLRKAEGEMDHELARRYRELDRQYKEQAEEHARRIVTLAIHRLAADVVSESTVTVVPLPSDEMKGRLIGREGRNIKALESATGVDVIIDDTPEAVTVSCFDPVRREVARLALARLIKDGRIQPARIEDAVEKARQELDETIWQEGQRAVLEAGVKGLNPEIIKLLGRLKYRFSYGENILQHSIEVSLIAGMVAAEIGASVDVAKAGGLLHDIGKALSHEVEGPHAEIGADVARKYGIPDEVHQAIIEHHDDEMGSVEAFLVAAADAVSAARPGARKDTLEHYVQRLEALENAAKEFPGIERVFAIQAGREVRIMVKPEEVDEIGATKLARDVTRRIEESLTYPGQIKVMVIRETRSTEYAR